MPNHWLIKSEPEAYAFTQLQKDKKTAWTGVRNYTARNSLRAMKKGDLLLFYHSNVGKAVVGIAKVVREAYVEDTDEGEWSAVDVAPVRALKAPVTLEAMREHPSLQAMVMWKQNRLSVTPVTAGEFDAIVLAGSTPAREPSPAAADDPAKAPPARPSAPAARKPAPKKR
jgi:predicted RNA-binding protein with PUA-like domain